MQRVKAWRRCGCAWTATLTVNGVRGYVNLGPDETQARAQLHRLETDNLQGRVTRTKPGRSFREVADSYQREVETQPGARPNTVKAVTSRLNGLRRYWGDAAVDGITLEQTRLYIEQASRRHSSNHTSALYSTYRCVLIHAQDHGILTTLPVPAKSRIRPMNTRQPNHLTVTEAEKVIRELPAPYDVIAEVAMLTGLRMGELLALTSDDLDRERRVLHIRGNLNADGTVGPPKTHNGLRVIPLSPRAYHLIDGCIGPGRLFPDVTINTCSRAIRAALHASGLHRPGRGWHAFRHLHQTMLEAAGTSIRDAAARLGHGANFVQTAAYGWVAEAGDAADIDGTRVRLHAAPPRST